ncbi:hypothetical protein ACTQ16_03335 [Prevotella sp. LCP21S3_D2]|uniref:hypothetical protein n=1 Tax=Prevotella sp. LCP21S3_D2 TaxID=3438800 RepID=UPI003F9B7233
MWILQKIKFIYEDKVLATIMLVLFNIMFVPLEQGPFSPVKIGFMGICPLIFIAKKPIVTKALVLAAIYWLVCYTLSLLKGEMRFSTLGFLGMYLILYVNFYSFVVKGTFTLDFFTKILQYLIMAYGITLIGQQLCVLVGLRNMPLFNLQNQFFLSITKLPALTLEPSHSARILTFAMLGYLRCLEIKKGKKPTIQEWFDKDHRTVTFLFLWSMLTMGSGTAFVGMGVLSFYFITRKTVIYIIPLIIGMFMLGQSMELKQMDRAVALAEAASTGSAEEAMAADGSGATRIIPVMNVFTKTDVTQLETWIGKKSMEKDKYWWKRTDTKIYDQYGLIAFIISLVFIYSCVIRHFFSIETLLYLILLGFTLGNIYYAWGCLMIMTGVRYFQNNYGEQLVLTTVQKKKYED